ncbi:hypothetical protein, partial [Escherichia coli]|uniref:hypothetical protein n=1 Tax=Escherichia coli TaxID=562 RepID=UPI000BCAA7C9
SEGGRKPASDQNSVKLTKSRIWIPEKGGLKMFRVMTNGLAWILLVLFILLAFEVLGELADIAVALVEKML